MTLNRAILLSICLLAGFAIAGFFVPMGILTGPAAEHFSVGVAAVAKQFSWLTSGLFAGYLISFFIYDRFNLKSVILFSYSTAFVLVFANRALDSYAMIPVVFGLLGVLLGLVSCGAGTMITRIWSGRARQTALVAQDAMFNAGGALFATLAGALVVREYLWDTTYLAVGAAFSVTAALALIAKFDKYEYRNEEEKEAPPPEWNVSVFIAWTSLFLFVFAKTTVIVWGPQYIQQTLGVGTEEGSRFMSNVYLAALIGSIVGTYLVSRINVRYLLLALVALAAFSTYGVTQTQSLSHILLLGYLFGISISATFNAYTAFGVSLVAHPTHKHISFFLIGAGMGAAIAPYLSSELVESSGSASSAIMMSAACHVAVFVSLLGAIYAARRTN